jgi:hypothetical protein
LLTLAEDLLDSGFFQELRWRANSDLIHYVKSVALFGRILDPAVTDLGDIDIRLETAERQGIGCSTAASVERGRESGRDLSFIASVIWKEGGSSRA